ncbi:hypothetical protein N7466_007196 [Penicillium verhagenii]|uniref:uncharacterized protein n=1 Tax=Penicillium verhagenii TaxID=1562060 RepID=UPI002545A3B3|nr:uncharacterized protein N7466_007196 [Penicillium verhagenii]KAJ5928240.1 hypothetical protein N7466_007196 [Penicillium verhagenii]
MHISCLIAFLGATGIALGLPVTNGEQLESASQMTDRGSLYPYVLSQVDEEAQRNELYKNTNKEALDKRFYYTRYTPDGSLNKRFYYHYTSPEKRDADLDKRFYYTPYGTTEKRESIDNTHSSPWSTYSERSNNVA